jgi:hypothetical protein
MWSGGKELVRKGTESGRRLTRARLGYYKKRMYYFQGNGRVEMRGESATVSFFAHQVLERHGTSLKNCRPVFQFSRFEISSTGVVK